METVREYIAPHLSADTLRRIQALEEERTSGFCPETSYQERLLTIFRNEKNAPRIKKALNNDFNLSSTISDHFLARLLARHGDTCIDFIMRTVEHGIKLSKKNKTSKVYTGDCAITYDPFQRTLISIYPKVSRHSARQ